MASTPFSILARRLPSTLSFTPRVPALLLPNAAQRAAIIASHPAAREPTVPSFWRTFSSSSSSNTPVAKMGYDSVSLQDAILNRRTIYQLTNTSPISDERIKEIVTHAIKNVPSSFNSQTARLVVLLKEEHVKFWDIVLDALKAVVPEEQWEHSSKRVLGFRAAYGSVLFYEDPVPTQQLQQKMPQYADRFPVWSEHTSAMHQLFLWAAFEAEGFGANLQHYNPLPDQRAAETWNIPKDWSLKAQLVFGKPTEDAKPMDKTFKPVEERLIVHGA